MAPGTFHPGRRPTSASGNPSTPRLTTACAGCLRSGRRPRRRQPFVMRPRGRECTLARHLRPVGERGLQPHARWAPRHTRYCPAVSRRSTRMKLFAKGAGPITAGVHLGVPASPPASDVASLTTEGETGEPSASRGTLGSQRTDLYQSTPRRWPRAPRSNACPSLIPDPARRRDPMRRAVGAAQQPTAEDPCLESGRPFPWAVQVMRMSCDERLATA